MNNNDVKDQMLNGFIGAISVDTCIIQEHGYRFEHGVLKHLEQFNTGNFRLLLPEIYVGEITNHLVEKADAAYEKICNELKDLGLCWLNRPGFRRGHMV